MPPLERIKAEGQRGRWRKVFTKLIHTRQLVSGLPTTCRRVELATTETANSPPDVCLLVLFINIFKNMY